MLYCREVQHDIPAICPLGNKLQQEEVSFSLQNSMSERAIAVKKMAFDLGFDACAIAAAGDADPERGLEKWITKGHHADMTWMARTQHIREDPRRKVREAQSVVVVARNYYAQRPDDSETKGRVSKYAWGRDYHRTLRKPLQTLGDYLSSLETGASTYCSIDSGPVLERAWAAKSGLGWIGKNSLVLRDALGSWFFLATAITTVALEPDEPAQDQCGTCRACLDACPTTAILEDRTVDSRLCISYHTIENRGDIPEHLHDAIGSWTFGCDICQEVCPWNRFATETSEKDFWPQDGRAALDLEAILALDEKSFKSTFAGSPIQRAKHSGMERNAAIVMRNLTKARPGA